MKTKDEFYHYMLKEFKHSGYDEFVKNKILISLIKDVHRGYDHDTIINSVLFHCGVNHETWRSYLFAFSLYKSYEMKSEPEKMKMN